MTEVIRVDDVVKEFALRNTHTLKDRLVWSLTGRRNQLVNHFRALDHVSFTVEQGDSDLTGRENVFLNGAILGMSKEQIEAAFDDIVAFSEIEKFIDTEVKFYSSGMFLRLAFAVAVHTSPDIFLVDEILAVGDEPFQRKCLDRIHEMQEQGTSLVIVSHDLDLIARLCNRGVLLHHGELLVDGTAQEAVDRLRSL